jgi:diaminopimelate epimerase
MLQLLKMQAAGNDFLILDAMKWTAPPASTRAQMARTFCQPHYGFGADGFLILEKKPDGVHWDFYNSDGSSANMCGNAARAVGRYLMDKDGTVSVEFFTNVGKVSAKRLNQNEVEVQFDLPIQPAGEIANPSATLINTGVPHAVVPVRDLMDTATLRETGLKIKSQFRQEGINVTYYTPKTANSIDSVTFERGVEDFTLACGTGALAAARVHLKQKDGDCEVNVPGGKLHVTFKANRAILRGEAHSIGWCIPSLEDSK